MGKGEDSDLRKEVEMNEHQISTEELARQYDLNLSTGLSDAEVKKVNYIFFNTSHSIFALFFDAISFLQFYLFAENYRFVVYYFAKIAENYIRAFNFCFTKTF